MRDSVDCKLWTRNRSEAVGSAKQMWDGTRSLIIAEQRSYNGPRKGDVREFNNNIKFAELIEI